MRFVIQRVTEKQRKSGWKSNRTDRKRIYGPDRCG